MQANADADPGSEHAVLAHLLRSYRDTPPGDTPRRWLLLEAAHVQGQTRIGPHGRVHLHMLALAWETRAWREVAGQVFRLLLVPLGHALGRLPLGNPGSARVSAFQPMALTPEIRGCLQAARTAVAQAASGPARAG
ncbi:DUF3703 domain-containing protein [Hydrogenophaga sp.]|uniref:DUF3703 domain-containing protein n=1 Tax=Hydrogenophaga sp. TaxID=1904254 RepID=UPI003569821D